jgi:hypothetical protein
VARGRRAPESSVGVALNAELAAAWPACGEYCGVRVCVRAAPVLYSAVSCVTCFMIRKSLSVQVQYHMSTVCEPRLGVSVIGQEFCCCWGGLATGTVLIDMIQYLLYCTYDSGTCQCRFNRNLNVHDFIQFGLSYLLQSVFCCGRYFLLLKPSPSLFPCSLVVCGCCVCLKVPG